MEFTSTEGILGFVMFVAQSGVAYLIADTRVKTRLDASDTQLKEATKRHEALLNSLAEKISHSELKTASIERDRVEIHKLIERLDMSKASKELFEFFRADMNNRFDKLEAMLSKFFEHSSRHN